MSKERPILFNTEMVQAIKAGRKTQTRRIIKPQPAFGNSELGTPVKCDDGTYTFKVAPYKHIYDGNYKPPCEPGDILWVRETFDNVELDHPWYYKADGDLRPKSWRGEPWLPSIHMPKEAARIFLRVEEVRLERLQDITDDDAKREGCSCFYGDTNMVVPETMNFIRVWNSTIKPADIDMYSFLANPWVWVITFERCPKPEGWCKART